MFFFLLFLSPPSMLIRIDDRIFILPTLMPTCLSQSPALVWHKKFDIHLFQISRSFSLEFIPTLFYNNFLVYVIQLSSEIYEIWRWGILGIFQ